MRRAASAPFAGTRRHVPAWRRRDGVRRQTRTADPELWELESEPYGGALVLEDLPRTTSDPAGAERILARFAAAGFVLLALTRPLRRELETQRAVARAYVDVLPGGDERRALQRLLALAGTRSPRTVVRCLRDAGDAAAARHHPAGAYWMRRTAYELARTAGSTAEAATIARAIERSAATHGAPRAARLWRRRAAALERLVV